MKHLFFWVLCGGSLFATPLWSLELFVASSFEQVARRVSPEAEIHMDGSSRLAEMIKAGAKPDAFVSADRYWVKEVQGVFPDAKISIIASNTLVLSGREPLDGKLPDFCKLRLGASMPEVPSGKYADKASRIMGCKESSFRAPNVAIVREWILKGEVDAGYIYKSDVVADSRLREWRTFSKVEIPIGVYGISFSSQGEAFLGRVKNSPILLESGFSMASTTSIDSLDSMDSLTEAGSSIPIPSRIDVSEVLLHSAMVGIVVIILCFFPATFLGFFLARMRSRWKFLLSILVLSPLVVPPVVSGLVLLKLFARKGIFSPLFDVVGYSPAFTWVGATMASIVVSFPLFVIMSRRAFESVDPALEVVAKSCGVSRWGTFWKVSLPLALPGVIAGAMLVFARSIGEFGATAVFAGNLAADGGTISLAIYRSLQIPNSSSLIWILSGFSILLSGVAILGYEFFVHRQAELLHRD